MLLSERTMRKPEAYLLGMISGMRRDSSRYISWLRSLCLMISAIIDIVHLC